MADLRIVDAPLLSTVKGTEKIPTGGEGNFSVSVNQVADFAKLKWFLATEGYVDNAVGNVQADLNLHKNNESNPHNVTKTQVGLGNVDNTADLDKPLSNADIAALSLKADKLYVDSQDQLKADKTYVNNALTGFTNGAAKFYPTLAEATADIANIDVKDKVEVGEVANGGTWYKATAGAASLTKSAYDPLTQSLKKTQSLLPINFIFNTKLANVNRLSSNVAFSKYINAVEKIDTISSSTSKTFAENVVLSNFSIQAVESIRKLKISNADGDLAQVTLLHSDSVASGQKSTRWIDFDTSKLSTLNVNTESDGGFRVLCPFVNANVDLSIGLVNAYDVSEFFTSVAQTTISTTALNCISTHGSQAIQFKVTPTTLTDFGYEVTADGASAFVKSILSRLRIKVRSTTTKTVPFELENCLLEKGIYSFTFENLTASFDYSKLINNKIEAEGNAYDSYSTSVLNSTTAPIENGIVALKINFEIGQVKSDDQIRVFDENGTEFDVQFAPDAYVNAREDLSIGYHFDGSLRAGTLYIIDDLAINASKIYEVRVYQSALKKTHVKAEIVAENGNMIRYSIFGYQFEFSKNLDDNALTKVFLKDTTQITIANAVKMYVANTSDPAVISSFAIGADRKLSIINEGAVFVDVEFIAKNSAFQQLTSNVLSQKTIYRIFSNGVVKIMSRASALTDIAATKLYGIQNTLFSNTPSSSAIFSAKYSLVRATFNSNPIRIKAMMYHGDSHRDGINYGANRPANVFNSVSTSSIDLRFGWRDSVGSESSTKWNIKNGDTWLSELVITLEPTTLPDSQYTAILNHLPTGFIGKRQLWTAAKNQLLSSVYDYSVDNIEWWYSADAEPYGGNPNYPTATMYVYSTELMRFIKEGVGSFDAIYNKFIAMVKGRFGADLSQVGNAYTAGTFAISQESRHIAPAMQWLYQQALKVGDTTKQNELKVLAKSIADALAAYYAAKGGIGLVGNGSDVGSSNVLGNGMRFLAIAIAMGQDTTGAMLTAFNGCEARLIDTTKFMPFPNRLDDGLGDIEARSRYLHYVAYAIYGYRLACSLLNREPAFDITPFMLNSLSGNGDVKDYEYCISESRRGERNTIGFMLHALTHKHLLGHVYAANATMQSLITNGMDEKANPKRMFNFDGKTSDPDNLRTSVAFNMHALADLWLSYHYGLYK